MNDDGEYYYDDDMYGDYYYNNCDGTQVEDPLETKYVMGKECMQQDIERSIQLLREVVAEDVDRGWWTFKALRMLTRASRLIERYSDMVSYYTEVAQFSHDDVACAKVQKAMTKSIDECQRIPDVWLHKMLEIALKVASTNDSQYHQLWLNMSIRRATVYLEASSFTEALAELQAATAACGAEPEEQQLQQYLATRFHIYALQMEVFKELGQYADLRRVYFALGRLPPPLSSIRMIAAVIECAGHLFLHDNNWEAAHDAFTTSLRRYTDAGDGKRYIVAKYVLLSSMLCGQPVDVFKNNEAYADNSALTPMRCLLEAFVACDIGAFLAVLHTSDYAGCFKEDKHFTPFIEPLLLQVRLNFMESYVACFTTLSLRLLAQQLHLSVNECKNLCHVAILREKIFAVIDGPAEQLVCCTESLPHHGTKPSALEALVDLSRATGAIMSL